MSTSAATAATAATATPTTHSVGIDIGGTKVAGAVVGDAARVLAGARADTPAADPDPEALWSAVAGVLADLLAQASTRGLAIRGVGLSCAGPIDTRAGTVSPINITGWHGFPLVARVRDVLDEAGRGGLAVHLAGDGTAMALAEQRHGAARGVGDVLGIVVSTGIGGGLVLAGRPFGGRTGNAGHVGHVVVDPRGELCTCGGIGCLETVASGPSAVRWALAQGWAPSGTGSPTGPPSGSPTGAGLAAAARAGDPVASAAIARAGRAVGEAVAGVAATVDLAAVVVGGGFAQSGEALFGPLRAAVARHAKLSFLHDLRVTPAALGVDAGVIGAAALVEA